MKSRIFQILLISVLLTGCQKEEKQSPFDISNNRIGFLTNEIKVSQLDSVFANDSIAKAITNKNSLSSSNEIEIYEKGGAKLLVLEVKNESDPSSTIENIQIIDPRYKTSSGLSSGGVFKNIKDHYTISKINNTLSTAVIFVDSIQAYFTIDKKELPKKFQNTTDAKIDVSDIPDSAKIKHFWISWDASN
ncbi:hypothetical protein [Aquimarina mytili]|uniref:Lipoprotein n=1 Tax=Aquimarina mytili TaxID=874423 RepID=A0A936ZWK1_9FLAO|nr:hypothetical protein [Aquimarina mytili]MBL0685612.1 hypothetical protein [Aquimarina mytili]